LARFAVAEELDIELAKKAKEMIQRHHDEQQQ